MSDPFPRTYMNYKFHPYSRDIDDNICPFCGYYRKNNISNFNFTMHLRKCYINGLETTQQQWLKKKQDELFLKAKIEN